VIYIDATTTRSRPNRVRLWRRSKRRSDQIPTYTLDLPIPPNTPENVPVEKELKIREGVIINWLLLIPPGHLALARTRVLYGLEPLLPAHEDAWIRGNAESLVIDDFFDPPEQPYRLRFQGWNEDTVFDHTFYFRVVVLPRQLALAHQLYLRRLGREISEAFMKGIGWV